MSCLQGKKVIITGGASGIGLSIVKELLDKGAFVFIFDQNAKAGRAVENKFTVQGKKIKFFKTNVCDGDEVKASLKKVLASAKTIDILINNVGCIYSGSILEISEDQWDYVIETNLKSLFHTCKNIIPVFLEQRKGNIINMSSVFGVQGTSGYIAYTTSKSGVIGFTKALAGELAAYKIRVNCISPGIVLTPSLLKINFSGKEEYSERSSRLAKYFPLTNSLGDPVDIAKVVGFLASEDAQWITGTNIVVDGGYSTYNPLNNI